MKQPAKDAYDTIVAQLNLMARLLSGADYDEFLDDVGLEVGLRIQARKEDGNPD